MKNETPDKTRLDDYKHRPEIRSQERRRNELLEEQKERRENALNASRNLEEAFQDVDEYPEEEELMECTSYESKQKKVKFNNMLMFSEWMVEVPIDLEEKWLFLLCPQGRRCILTAHKGVTRAFSRGGQLLAKFQSPLPGGSNMDTHGRNWSKNGKTLLDCIYHEGTHTFFILDLLFWHRKSYMECDTAFRFYWIKTKILEEVPGLLNPTHRYNFKLLQSLPADSEGLSTLLCRYPYHPENVPAIDGILFYHVDSLYTAGSTPLVIWLKTFMVNELLGPDIGISQGYNIEKPQNYTTAHKFMDDFDQQANKKKQKQIKQAHQFQNIESQPINQSKESKPTQPYQNKESRASYQFQNKDRNPSSYSSSSNMNWREPCNSKQADSMEWRQAQPHSSSNWRQSQQTTSENWRVK